ncbi:MAG: hypothetical protein RM347_007805 [Nostoc sp. ChiQUE02]
MLISRPVPGDALSFDCAQLPLVVGAASGREVSPIPSPFLFPDIF